jgi:hypothetical protein
MCRKTLRGYDILQNFDPQKCFLMPQMDLEGFRPQILKLVPTTKIFPPSQFLQFFNPESTKIDKKLYNVPIWVIPSHFGRI